MSIYTDELRHHGILGMKWGVRRYQNEDGSYTAAGEKRRSAREQISDAKKKYKEAKKTANAGYKAATKEWKQANKGRSTKDFMNNYSDADKKFDELGDKYLNDAANAKKTYKNEVRKIRENEARKTRDNISKSVSKAQNFMVKNGKKMLAQRLNSVALSQACGAGIERMQGNYFNSVLRATASDLMFEQAKKLYYD